MIYLILSIIYIYLCFACGDYLMGTFWSVISVLALTISVYYSNKKGEGRLNKI